MSKGKKIYFLVLLLITILVTTFYFSYAIFSNTQEEHGKLNIVAGTLNYKIESSELDSDSIMLSANTSKEIKIKLTSLNEVCSKYELYYTLDKTNDKVSVGYSKDTKDNVLGTIEGSSSKMISIVVRNDSDTSSKVTFKVLGGLLNNELALKDGNSLNKVVSIYYQEDILNGTDPIIKDNLVPVTISDTGVVTKADTTKKWYNYEKKNWANSVILKDESVVYKNGETIPESNIESYFVWIPKYSYQLFDLGNYSSLTSISDKTQEIKIKFGTSNTSDSVSGECTTPFSNNQGIAGSSGNCKVGDYMTHPAFLAFDTLGLWVGKFETGYDGATTTTAAQVNNVDTSKIIIKPNVYSWRNITVGNAFKNSYDYQRNLDSHMMKNTEWGSVAYLQHSAYGSGASVRINNNKAYITGYAATIEPTLGYNGGTSIEGNRNELTNLRVDGTYTTNYLNSNSVVASTTNNYTGIYDMSGGSWDYVMGYTIGATTVGGNSTITSLYPNFFNDSTYSKYWDKYTSTANTNYNNRILGDGSGEMGLFMGEKDPDSSTRSKSSWYKDYAIFIDSSNSWFTRSGYWSGGAAAGIFAFGEHAGSVSASISYRIVLAPTK